MQIFSGNIINPGRKFFGQNAEGRETKKSEQVEYRMPSIKKAAFLIIENNVSQNIKKIRFKTWLNSDSLFYSSSYNYSLEYDGKNFKFIDAYVSNEKRCGDETVRSLTFKQKNEILQVLEETLNQEKDLERLKILQRVYIGTKALEPSDAKKTK